MARRLNPDQRSELERLFKSCMLTLDFITDRADFPATAISAGREGLRKAYDSGNLRALRMAERDFLEWTEALNPADRDELEARLRVLVGHDRDLTRDQEQKRVQNVLSKGRIDSEDEYRAAIARLDRIAGQPQHLEEADALEALTVAFGIRH